MSVQCDSHHVGPGDFITLLVFIDVASEGYLFEVQSQESGSNGDVTGVVVFFHTCSGHHAHPLSSKLSADPRRLGGNRFSDGKGCPLDVIIGLAASIVSALGGV